MKSLSMLIRTEKIIGSVAIAGLGSLASLWTNCIFVISLPRDTNYYNKNDRQVYELIYETVHYEYIAICIIAILTLIWGLVKCDRKYLFPWACLKLCENLTLCIGTYLILSERNFQEFTGMIPLGITAICINIYTALCVYKAYKRMMIPLPPQNLQNRSTKQEEENEDVQLRIEELKPLSCETEVISDSDRKYLIPNMTSVNNESKRLKNIPFAHISTNKQVAPT